MARVIWPVPMPEEGLAGEAAGLLAAIGHRGGRRRLHRGGQLRGQPFGQQQGVLDTRPSPGRTQRLSSAAAIVAAAKSSSPLPRRTSISAVSTAESSFVSAASSSSCPRPTPA